MSLKTDESQAYVWYIDRWRTDEAVQSLSLEARGLWREMLDAMHMANPRGALMANAWQISEKDMAKRYGTGLAKIRRCLKELEDKKIFSRAEQSDAYLPAGTIFCRRIYRAWVRQKRLSGKRSAAGRCGAMARWNGKRNGKKGAPDPTRPDSTQSNSKKKDIKKEKFFVEFATFMETYPYRPNNPKKLAFAQWNARLKEGRTTAELIRAAKNYRLFCEREGKEGEFILMASTFLGPNERYVEFLEGVPAKGGSDGRVRKPYLAKDWESLER